jgi:hypothetical protein
MGMIESEVNVAGRGRMLLHLEMIISRQSSGTRSLESMNEAQVCGGGQIALLRAASGFRSVRPPRAREPHMHLSTRRAATTPEQCI